MVLNSEMPFERLLVFNFGNQFAVDESHDARALAYHLEFVPLLGLEHSLDPFLVFGVRVFVRVEPSSHSDSINSTWFGLVDFALVTLWFALTANEPESQTGIEPFVIEGNLYFRLDFEILHFEIGNDPYVDLREKMEFSLFGHEGFDLGPRGPTRGALTVEERKPGRFVFFSEKVRSGGEEQNERDKEVVHSYLAEVEGTAFAKLGVSEDFQGVTNGMSKAK